MNLSQLGLILNIIGTIIIAIWGLPNWYYSQTGATFVTMSVNVEEGKKYNRRRKVKAYLGLVLLGIGFLCQLADSFRHQG